MAEVMVEEEDQADDQDGRCPAVTALERRQHVAPEARLLDHAGHGADGEQGGHQRPRRQGREVERQLEGVARDLAEPRRQEGEAGDAGDAEAAGGQCPGPGPPWQRAGAEVAAARLGGASRPPPAVQVAPAEPQPGRACRQQPWDARGELQVGQHEEIRDEPADAHHQLADDDGPHHDREKPPEAEDEGGPGAGGGWMAVDHDGGSC
jgi:hypothetical protein